MRTDLLNGNTKKTIRTNSVYCLPTYYKKKKSICFKQKTIITRLIEKKKNKLVKVNYSSNYNTDKIHFQNDRENSFSVGYVANIYS